jgi:hypothetical protein
LAARPHEQPPDAPGTPGETQGRVCDRNKSGPHTGVTHQGSKGESNSTICISVLSPLSCFHVHVENIFRQTLAKKKKKKEQRNVQCKHDANSAQIRQSRTKGRSADRNYKNSESNPKAAQKIFPGCFDFLLDFSVVNHHHFVFPIQGDEDSFTAWNIFQTCNIGKQFIKSDKIEKI